MDENNNVTNDEVKAEEVSNVENNEVKTDVVNIDASVLTNEEIKNISEDVITTPQENVELPELPKIEPEVVTPNNTSKPVTENKPKKNLQNRFCKKSNFLNICLFFRVQNYNTFSVLCNNFQ